MTKAVFKVGSLCGALARIELNFKPSELTAYADLGEPLPQTLWLRGVLVLRRSPSRGGRLARETHSSAAQASELSRHLILAQEEERKRISRELHDEAGQGLMVLRLYLATRASENQNPESRPKIIERALDMLDRTIGDLRRIIARLSPRTLEELGLLPAIRKEARELSKNTGMKAHLRLPHEVDQLDRETEVAIYRFVQEALHNIAKHSQAKNFSVEVERNDGMLCLLVEDDGIGFSGGGNARRRTFGLLGMRERIMALGGMVRIRSRKARGTRLTVMLPVSHAAANRKLPTRVEAREFKNSAAVPRRG